MVRRILHLFDREFRGLHETAYLLGFFALFSQILALIRDRLLAGTFGASLPLDIYYAAFRIPDFLFVSLASLFGAATLIPLLEEKYTKNENEAKRFIGRIFTAFFFVMVAFSVVLFLLMPLFAPFAAPGFGEEEKKTLVMLSRILLLSPLLLGASNLLGSVTQTLRKFFLFALGPVLYNAGIIVGIVFFYPTLGLKGIVLGVIFGALLHLSIQIPSLIRSGFYPKISLPKTREVINVMKISLPRTIGLSANHIVLLVFVALASLLSSGSISIFQLSFNLQSVPLSIVGVSYSIAAFPTLARLFSKRAHREFFEHMVRAVQHIIFWSIPIIFLFIILRAHIVRVILGSGEFSWSDTRLVAASLAIFTTSLLAQNLILLFTRGYYASGNSKIPLIANVSSGIFTVALMLAILFGFENSFFIRAFFEALFRLDGVENIAVISLPLAFAIGSIVNASILWALFQKRFGNLNRRSARVFLQSLTASFVLAIGVHTALRLFDDILNLTTFFGVLLHGFLAGLCGIMLWAAALFFMKNEEIESVYTAIRRRF